MVLYERRGKWRSLSDRRSHCRWSVRGGILPFLSGFLGVYALLPCLLGHGLPTQQSKRKRIKYINTLSLLLIELQTHTHTHTHSLSLTYISQRPHHIHRCLIHTCVSLSVFVLLCVYVCVREWESLSINVCVFRK